MAQPTAKMSERTENGEAGETSSKNVETKTEDNVEGSQTSEMESVGHREKWPAAEAFARIECGVLRKGVYFTGDNLESVEEKDEVTDLKGDLEYLGAVSSSCGSTIKFSSEEMTKLYNKNMDKVSSTKSGTVGV